MDPALRRSLYALMLVAATGMMVARVVNVESLYEPSLYKAYPARKWPTEKPAPQPNFGSNDRARWATVKAFVEEDTFVIGRRLSDPGSKTGYRDEGILFSPGFGSIDVVLHPTRNEFYSTKPPLLTHIAACEYMILFHVFKKEIGVHKWETVVPILLLTNVLPLVLALWLLSRLIEAYGTTDWGRLYVFAVACFATFLPTFANTLNNHVPAACCIMYATYALLAPGSRPALRNPVRVLQMGLFSGLAACMDLPALAFAGVIGLIILIHHWRATLLFVPALAMPIACQTLLNYQMFGTWEPIYAKFGGEWYEYAGSHWAKRHDPNAEGIDFAKEPKHIYAFHLLFGHHGLFALTPVWLLALLGMAMRLRRAVVSGWCHGCTLFIMTVVIGFYVVRTNNWGGWTSGPRWLFWLTPLFLLAMLPAVDWLGRWRLGRLFAYLCFAVSAFSATYPWSNPWRHPWIYQLCEYKNWVRY